MQGKDPLFSQSQALNLNLLADGPKPQTLNLPEECSIVAPDPDLRQCVHLQSGLHGGQLASVPQSGDRARVPEVRISEEQHYDSSPDTVQRLPLGRPGGSSGSVSSGFSGFRYFPQPPRIIAAPLLFWASSFRFGLKVFRQPRFAMGRARDLSLVFSINLAHLCGVVAAPCLDLGWLSPSI